jgi:hypothetical protein
MEFISKLRWVIVVVALLVVLILAGWGIAAIARNTFAGSGGDDTQLTTDEVTSLEDISIDTVRYTQEGPIVGSSEQRSYVIEVTRSVVIMRVYSDYGQKVISEKSYLNTEFAFDSLVEAIGNENVLLRAPETDADDDFAEIGVCPEGRRYIVEIGSEVRRWITDCPRALKTAGGNMPAIRRLFSKQVPDFKTLIKNTGLR